jgi:hypothetical protein
MERSEIRGDFIREQKTRIALRSTRATKPQKTPRFPGAFSRSANTG